AHHVSQVLRAGHAAENHMPFGVHVEEPEAHLRRAVLGMERGQGATGLVGGDRYSLLQDARTKLWVGCGGGVAFDMWNRFPGRHSRLVAGHELAPFELAHEVREEVVVNRNARGDWLPE